LTGHFGRRSRRYGRRIDGRTLRRLTSVTNHVPNANQRGVVEDPTVVDTTGDHLIAFTSNR
jgi:methyl coenzyme M reductase subunit C-like uncharacterized protein (methanogenesis marker protein 7)